MATTLTQSEEAQFAQTIEMFEVITQSQPNDYQSLEILKEAYSKLGREAEVISTAKRIAQAYVQTGQFSSAILEYETILQQHPNDPEAQKALREIEAKSSTSITYGEETAMFRRPTEGGDLAQPAATSFSGVLEDGRKPMHKIFVKSKLMAESDFDACWPSLDLTTPPTEVCDSFLRTVADKGLVATETALKLISDRSRLPCLPLERYEVDFELARTFPAASCRRWCVLPFDRMSKSVLIATTNPFNQQVIKELQAATSDRLLWYLASPAEIVKNLQKIFR